MSAKAFTLLCVFSSKRSHIDYLSVISSGPITDRDYLEKDWLPNNSGDCNGVEDNQSMERKPHSVKVYTTQVNSTFRAL